MIVGFALSPDEFRWLMCFLIGMVLWFEF